MTYAKKWFFYGLVGFLLWAFGYDEILSLSHNGKLTPGSFALLLILFFCLIMLPLTFGCREFVGASRFYDRFGFWPPPSSKNRQQLSVLRPTVDQKLAEIMPEYKKFTADEVSDILLKKIRAAQSQLDEIESLQGRWEKALDIARYFGFEFSEKNRNKIDGAARLGKENVYV